MVQRFAACLHVREQTVGKTEVEWDIAIQFFIEVEITDSGFPIIAKGKRGPHEVKAIQPVEIADPVAL